MIQGITTKLCTEPPGYLQSALKKQYCYCHFVRSEKWCCLKNVFTVLWLCLKISLYLLETHDFVDKWCNDRDLLQMKPEEGVGGIYCRCQLGRSWWLRSLGDGYMFVHCSVFYSVHVWRFPIQDVSNRKL